MMLDATGAEQIRDAFATAADTAGEHADDVAGLASVLTEGAEAYAGLGMAASTVAHLRDAAASTTAAQASLGTAGERLQAALGDFNDRDGRVAEAVAAAGNLMLAEGYRESFALPGAASTGVVPAVAAAAPAALALPAAPRVPFGDGDTRQASWNADHPRSDYGSLTLIDDEAGAVTVRVSRDEMEDMLTHLRWLSEYGSGSEDWMDCASGARLSWGEWEATDDGARVLNLFGIDNTGDHSAALQLSQDDLLELRHWLLQHVRQPAGVVR